MSIVSRAQSDSSPSLTDYLSWGHPGPTHARRDFIGTLGKLHGLDNDDFFTELAFRSGLQRVLASTAELVCERCFLVGC